MFCKFCGKQIAEGEVCFCDQAVAQRTTAAQAPNTAPVATAAPAAAPAASIDVGAIVGKILGSFKALFKNTSYIGSDLTTPIAFSVFSLVMHMLSWLCLKSMLLGDLPIKLKGITGTFVWCGCLSFLVPLAFYFLIPVLANLVHKEAVNVRKAFACAAAASVIPSALFLLGGVVGLVIDKVGYILILTAALAGIINFTKLTGKLVRGNSAVSAFLVALVVAAMVGLTVYIEYGVIKDFVAAAVSNMLGDLLGGLGGLGGMGGLFG